jgi:hypothetical protein
MRTIGVKLNFISDKGYNYMMKKMFSQGPTNLTRVFIGSNDISHYAIKMSHDFIDKRELNIFSDVSFKLSANKPGTVFLSGMKKYQTESSLKKYFDEQKAGVITGVEVHRGRKG